VLVCHCLVSLVAFWRCLPVIANHTTSKRSDTSTCPDTPIVDGLRRRPVFDDCEKTHVVDRVCVDEVEQEWREVDELNDPDKSADLQAVFERTRRSRPHGVHTDVLRSSPSHREQVSLSLLLLAQVPGKEFSKSPRSSSARTPTSDCGTPRLSTCGRVGGAEIETRNVTAAWYPCVAVLGRSPGRVCRGDADLSSSRQTWLLRPYVHGKD